MILPHPISPNNKTFCEPVISLLNHWEKNNNPLNILSLQMFERKRLEKVKMIGTNPCIYKRMFSKYVVCIQFIKRLMTKVTKMLQLNFGIA